MKDVPGFRNRQIESETQSTGVTGLHDRFD